MFYRISRTLRVYAVPTLLMASLAACALGRTVVEIQPPVGANSEGATPVKITQARDLRHFETDPRDPSQPSLGDEKDIKNPVITARAIGRKRGGFGNAMGDVALPEGNTVSALVRGAAQRALQERGYRVVEEGSPDYASAVPLAIDINQFWAWFTPGMFEVRADFRSSVTMVSDKLLRKSPVPVEGRATHSSAAVFESTWKDVIERGVADLSKNMVSQIKPASEVH